MSSAKIAISLDPEALKQVDQLVEGGLFPSRSKLIQDAVAENDKVVILWQMQGTHTADLFGIPPTGKAVKVRGMSLLRLENGQVVENTVSEDTMGLMQQLGLAPTPGG